MALDHEQPFVKGECQTTDLPDRAGRARLRTPEEALLANRRVS